MKRTERRLLTCLSALYLVLGLHGAALGQGLTSLETDDLRLLYFDPVQTYLAPHVARCFQNALKTHNSLLGFEPQEQATVFLKDYSDHGNAAAGAIPRNTILIDVAPSSFTFETMTTNERMCGAMNHELVHVASTDQATARDQGARNFFGGKVYANAEHPETILYAYLTNPRAASPSWYMEGLAVFMETWMAGGFGRAQGAYDEMVFRSMVRDESHFYDPLGLESEGNKIDFQVGVNNYLYGTRFVTYLAYTYSPDLLIDWIRRQEGSGAHYTTHFEQVFGLTLNEAWQDWIAFEHEFQTRNLAAVRQYPITPYRDLSDRGLGSISRTYFDPETRKLHWALRYPGVIAHIGNMSIDDGTTESLADIKGPMLYRVTAPAFDPETKTLFYTTDNYAYRDLMSIDTESGESMMLLRDARIGELVFNKTDRSLWGVRHLNGIATLVRLEYPYDGWSQVISLPYGELFYDMDISPDGKLLSSSFGELNGDQSLRIFDIEALLNGESSPVQQFDFGQAVPEGFVFSPDGKYLYGSSYYTGISNIFRYELATAELEAVSNAEAGFFRPVPLDDGTLVVFRYTGEGLLPAIIDPQPLDDVSAISFLGTEVIAKYPVLQNWQVGSPADVALDDMITHEGAYSGPSNIDLESMYPVVEGYKDEVAIGYNFSFSDPLMLEDIEFSVSHSIASSLPSDEDVHATLEWTHVSTRQTPLSGVWSFALRHNPADFYDLFGPTKIGRKGQSASIGYEKTLISDSPHDMRLDVDLSHYQNMDKLPRYQNVDVTFNELTQLSAGISYSYLRSSLGNVDDEKGIKWGLYGAASHVNGDTIPRFYANLEFGIPLPLGNSSIWLRNYGGYANGAVDDPFANFYFGGFGNNYVDRGAIKRYREAYAMPGFELNEIAGRNFYRSMLEWNLPPIRFSEVGGSRFYLSWARPAIFASTLYTNSNSNTLKRNVTSVGAQLDFRFTIMSRLDMTLSMGYAIGSGDIAGSPDEFMLSLKIL